MGNLSVVLTHAPSDVQLSECVPEHKSIHQFHAHIGPTETRKHDIIGELVAIALIHCIDCPKLLEHAPEIIKMQTHK